MKAQMNKVDALAMQLAKVAFESGAPREIWAALICEARGVGHNLPRNQGELVAAYFTDIYDTRDALDNAGIKVPFTRTKVAA